MSRAGHITKGTIKDPAAPVLDLAADIGVVGPPSGRPPVEHPVRCADSAIDSPRAIAIAKPIVLAQGDFSSKIEHLGVVEMRQVAPFSAF